MTNEEKKKLFKLFDSDNTKGNNTKGIGLGLCISKMLVEQFGGDIDVISQPNMAASFTFKFKCYNELKPESP